MATLVLSTVGTALAGPAGALLGSLVGQSIDQQLMGGGARKGPRLGDLSVQTSSYGTPVPRLYGTMRVAGTIIWATDLKEDSQLQGDGKSQPETVVYSYSVSLAVALSCRRAVRVKRIWADGKLIRGSAGDLKVQTKFRFYPGSEGQAVDSLIGSVEGVGKAPAYRGLALAVFEDLQLGPFGNRIPALTFEVVADEEEGVEIGDLLNDASGGAIRCNDQRMIGGYAAYGDDIAAAITPLMEAFAVELQDEQGALSSPGAARIHSPSGLEVGASASGEAAPRIERSLAPATTVPSLLTLSYYEPARDYQTSQSRVSSPGAGRAERALSLACSLSAGTAKAVAENLLLRGWALRDRLIVRLPFKYLDVRPGDQVKIPEVVGDWVAEEVEVDRFVVSVILRPAWAYAVERNADPGRSNAQPDVQAAPTRLALFDLPDPATSQPTLALAATSPSGQWISVPIEVEIGGTAIASRTAMGEAVLGQVQTVLPVGQPVLIDALSEIEVELANADHWLESRDDAALAMGANLAAVGDELIQFGQVQPLGEGRFRLSRFLRGRRGSEWAMAGHAVGEDFVLLDARSLKPIALPAEMLGAPCTITAHGPGDFAGLSSVTRVANGEAMRPLSPAQLQVGTGTDGLVRISWTRRSRLAWGWPDEIEAPSDPSVHGFRLRVSGPLATIERDTDESQIELSSLEMSALGSGPITVDIRQIGSLALSRPSSIVIS